MVYGTGDPVSLEFSFNISDKVFTDQQIIASPSSRNQFNNFAKVLNQRVVAFTTIAPIGIVCSKSGLNFKHQCSETVGAITWGREWQSDKVIKGNRHGYVRSIMPTNLPTNTSEW
jgi:hypothetical protein